MPAGIPLLIGAAAALVGHASVQFSGDQYQLIVRTNAPITAGAVGELTADKIRLTVPGATLGLPAYAFQDPAGGVVRAIQTKPGEVAFDFPLPSDRTCEGPVVIDSPRRPGVVAHVMCSLTPPAPTVDDAPEAGTAEAAPGATPETKAADQAQDAAKDADKKSEPVDETTPWTALIPILLLMGLAGGAWFYAQRKVAPARQLQVVESVSLGPRRQLVVARFRGELLVVGSSENGISLLASRPIEGHHVPAVHTAVHVPSASQAVTQPYMPNGGHAASHSAPPAPSPATDAGSLKTLVERMSRVSETSRPGEKGGSFESMLEESYEDENLRRKLAKGLGGRVA